MKMNDQSKTKAVTLLLTVFVISILYASLASGQTGAGVTNVSTSYKLPQTPDNLTNDKGAIHTVRLSSQQQDTKWKAYVGNVSSTFVLDDASDYSIYQWTVDSFTGQVYLTRGSITWSTVQCASIANKETEDTQLTHISTKPDSVNSTFTSTAHKDFSVGTTPFSNGDCFSTATWMNDTTQTPGPNTPFTEVLLYDTTSTNMIYATFVENDKHGYKGDEAGQNTTYDFQVIVPDNATASSPPLLYYFYIELS